MTEREYFAWIREAIGRGALIEIDISKEVGDPQKLVETAIEARKKAESVARRQGDENLKYEQVWCVVDVDAHPRLQAAVATAAGQGIGLAISSPCFEIWPLLHLRDQRAHLSSKECEKALAKQIPGYDKHLDCSKLVGSYQLARARAQRLDAMHDGNNTIDRNPSSQVWRLVDEIVAAAAGSAPPGAPLELE